MVTELFAIEESIASVYRKMGRGRNVPVDQNQKKPKIRDDKEENIISGSVLMQIQYSYQTMLSMA